LVHLSCVTRKRTVAGHGKIRLNLLYDDNREELKVFVHEAAGLPGGDQPDPPDPQVAFPCCSVVSTDHFPRLRST